MKLEEKIMTKKPVHRTPAGQVLEDLIIEITYTAFLLRAVGAQNGTLSPSGGSYWGLLRTLKLEGPKTVPEIARSRPVSRQSMQKLANECLERGYIELMDNPAHQRSKLLCLTAKGDAFFQELNDHLARECEIYSENLSAVDAAQFQTSVTVVRQVRNKLKEILNQ